MTAYSTGISPVIGSAKGGGVRKYSPNDDERHRERYNPDQKEKKDKDKKERAKDTFSEMFAAKSKTPEKTEAASSMTALLLRPDIMSHSAAYVRAKILASTLAFELIKLNIAE
ncbi:MAG: hypothetical protein FWG94_05710 [Oscillospiraceae bacterium]|nr:hypothetical protein [Oscillospiraceae bacterium]